MKKEVGGHEVLGWVVVETDRWTQPRLIGGMFYPNERSHAENRRKIQRDRLKNSYGVEVAAVVRVPPFRKAPQDSPPESQHEDEDNPLKEDH